MPCDLPLRLILCSPQPSGNATSFRRMVPMNGRATVLAALPTVKLSARPWLLWPLFFPDTWVESKRPWRHAILERLVATPTSSQSPYVPRGYGEWKGNLTLFAMFRPRFGSSSEDHHFCRTFKGDTLKDAFSRHRAFLFSQLALKPGMRVLHVACGTGTATLELAFFSNVYVVGIDADKTKISQAQKEAENARMTHLVTFAHVADITKVDEIFPASSFDAAFAIEVLNFLPSFSAIYRPLSVVIREGGHLAVYEWCWTTRLNPRDPEHRLLSRSIEDALPIVRRQISHRTIEAAVISLNENHFQVIQAEDLAIRKSLASIPWYSDLQSALSERHYFSRWLDTEERGGLHKQAAGFILEAGRLGLFTPMALVVGKRA